MIKWDGFRVTMLKKYHLVCMYTSAHLIVSLLVMFSVAENCFQGSKESADKNRDSLQRYYDLVVKDIVDSEEVYTSELMVSNFTANLAFTLVHTQTCQIRFTLAEKNNRIFIN